MAFSVKEHIPLQVITRSGPSQGGGLCRDGEISVTPHLISAVTSFAPRRSAGHHALSLSVSHTHTHLKCYEMVGICQ